MSLIYSRSEEGALRQGEIITNLAHFRLALDTIDAPEEGKAMDKVTHSVAVVLSQDCDLTQDWEKVQAASTMQVRPLPNVLLAEMMVAGTLSASVDTRVWNRVVINKDERYHYLEAVPREVDAVEKGLPSLGIDFKRYFTVPTDEIYKQIEREAKRRCRLKNPYLEHLSTRFCYYQFRVALPVEHDSAA